MTLIPWKSKRQENGGRALSPTSGFREELDRLFDTFFGGALESPRPWGAMASWAPPLDVEESDKEIHVHAEIPGVNPDDLQISISGNALVISGEKRETHERKEGACFYQERRWGSFRREVPLPTAVDSDNVRAEYKDGVLVVELKKSQEALPKRIAVKAR